MSDVVVVMGVSSVGKTTVAKGLSALMGWEFAEGDAFHPQANIDKMHAGTPDRRRPVAVVAVDPGLDGGGDR